MSKPEENKNARKLRALEVLRSVSGQQNTPEIEPAIEERDITDEFREARSKAISRIGLAGSVSSGKISDHLSENGFSRELIEDVMQSLDKDGYLDDHRCGRRIMLRHRDQKAKSKAMMSLLLRQQGIDSAVIDELLTEMPDDKETLKQLLERENPSSRQDQARVLRKMMGRGFDRYLILQCMNEVQS